MRPQSITVLCVLLFALGASLAVRFIVQFALAPNLYSFVMLIISLLALYSYYGLWNMRLWSIGLFLILWSTIVILLLVAAPKITMIMFMRSFYIIGIVIVFLFVVLPHRDKFSSGPVWRPRSGNNH